MITKDSEGMADDIRRSRACKTESVSPADFDLLTYHGVTGDCFNAAICWETYQEAYLAAGHAEQGIGSISSM